MYRLVTDVGEIRKYLSGARIIAFDIETAPDDPYRDEESAGKRPPPALDPHKAHIVGISFSVCEHGVPVTGSGSGIYVPLAHRIGINVDQAEVMAFLAEFATDTNITKVAHNLAFESAFLYAHGIVIQAPVYDTIAAAQMTLKSNTVFRSLADCGLKTLVRELLDTELPTFSDVTGDRHFDELDPTDPATGVPGETIRYACADTDYTLRLYHLFNEWFDAYLPRHRYIVEQVESPTAVYVGLMKYNGLLVDADLMNEKSAECEERLSKLQEDIAFIIGDVHIGANASTAAFKDYLYNDLGLPVLKTTARYREAADDETMVLLSEWCETHRPELVPLFRLVQDYRRWGKIKSTYIAGYAQHMNTASGRIHPDLMPLATETGRFACRKPNLQNCPRTGADDIGVRNFFIAPEGMTLLSVDLSQIELRIGAFYCRDEKMLETYRLDGDIHEQTASVIYDDASDTASGKHNKEQRTIAKNVNFGTFYGLFPRGLQRALKTKANLNVTLEQCEMIIANLKAGYPALTQWQEETKVQAAIRRYTETWQGRRRYLPEITSADWGKRSFAERCALNTPIQGTAADILKLALGRIIEGLPHRSWLRPLLQIHDELIFEIPDTRVPEAVAFIKTCMETRPFSEFDIPIIAETSIGARFGEMKEMRSI